MGKWKVAVVGCGIFANENYFPNIAKVADAECVAAVDIIPERAENSARMFGIRDVYSSVYDLIEKCSFDIVINSASIQAHHEINMAVLKAGKHLISQKPAALSVQDITEQIDTAKKFNVKFNCVPIHLMTPDMIMAMRMIREGAIGEVLSVKCVSTHGGPEYFQYRDADPSWFYEPDAGALYDMGVHALHKVTGIMGSAKKVACMASTALETREVRSGTYNGKILNTGNIPDTYYITLEFGNGKIGFVDTGYTQIATRTPPLEVFGSRGVISFEPHNNIWPNPKVYIDSKELGLRGWVNPETWVIPHRPSVFNQCCCLPDMIQAIETDEKPLLTPEQARHVIEIMCAIPEAINTGGTVELHTEF